MKNSLIWRGVLIFAVVAIALLSLYPPDQKINLGLDLRGGIHLVLEVLTEDALRAETDKDMEIVRERLAEQGVTGAEAVRQADSSFVLTGVAAADDGEVRAVVRDYLQGWEFRREGARLIFERRGDRDDDIRDQAVRQAETTIRNRIDAFGVAEPVIQRQGLGSNRIVVQLPGVDDPERVKRLIKNTAFLEFRLVDYPQAGGVAGSREEVLANYGGTLPDRLEILVEEERDPDTNDVLARYYYAVERAQVITGRDLRDAYPTLGEFNQPVVGFSLNADGAERFARATGDNIGRGLAIVLDGKVQTAPRINDRIRDSGQITGSYTQQQVEDLVTVLKSGALPAGINYLEERTVGPSLGQDSIEQGLRAGLIAVVLVILVMLIVYKGAGINAVVALLLNFVFVFGALAYFGATLTLPGIAGIILVIGMAVDANVLVFERIREELHNGRTVKSAVESGFAKALSSILDANVTTLIAALFLFNFGTGPIRGFAVTLSIGIVASVFTAVFVSRWLFDLWLSRKTVVEKLWI